MLSLFSGISADIVALDRAGICIRAYASSEIDEGALAVVKHSLNVRIPPLKHYELGDVLFLKDEYITELAAEMQLDLVIGGSPCQDLSRMGGENRRGLEGSRSCLFYEYVNM